VNLLQLPISVQPTTSLGATFHTRKAPKARSTSPTSTGANTLLVQTSSYRTAMRRPITAAFVPASAPCYDLEGFVHAEPSNS
jgi:hypothetical protein